MIKEQDILIRPEATIIEALKQLNATRKKHLIVVGPDEHGDGALLGVLTDGDIRRSIIESADLELPVKRVMNARPVKVSEQATPDEVARLLTARLSILPVVDAHGRFVGYHSAQRKLYRDPIRDRSVTILGMGYVGLTLGIVLADSGFRVYGYDVNRDLVRRLEKGLSPFYEQGLSKYLALHAGQGLKFRSELEEARSDVYIITVGTPLLPGTKKPDVGYLEAALTDIGRVLQAGNLVILRSTVPVGTCAGKAIPILERESGLTCGKDFMLSFAPERTAEGRALKELRTNPQIVGSNDPLAYRVTAELFNTFTSTTIDVGSLEAAELCKLIDNTFRDHVFAYANNLAPLAEKLGLNITDLFDAVNLLYSRNAIPRPSPGVGGPCLSKDPFILRMAFDEHGLDPGLLMDVRRINEAGPAHLAQKLRQLLARAGKTIEGCEKIVLVGLAFKGEPETSDLRDSTALWFLDELPG
ncbi:MAG: nucleotide sugar dehydrogenase, partial [Desulfovibrionaceae bacterium]